MNMKLLIAGALIALISFSAHAKGGGGSNDVYFAAAQQGDVATLQQFFAADANAPSLLNDLFRAAVLSGQKSTTEYLLSQHAEVNKKGFIDMTPLAHLAMYGTADDAKCAEVAKVLIAHGAEIDPVDGYQATPLMHAVEMKKSQLARVLLDHGANIVVRFTGANSGLTPLHMAVRHKDKETVAVLLEFKAPIDAVDREGTTPLTMAEGRDETEIVALLRAANPEAAREASPYSPLPSNEEIRALAQRIANGDDAAYDELTAMMVKLYQEIKNYEAERPRVIALLGRMHVAFDLLGQEAGKGNAHALEALKRALRAKNTFTSFAPDALGVAAAGGNKEALDTLLHYRDWDLLESQARFALCKPIEANFPPAVDESAKWLLSLRGMDREGGVVMETTNALASAAAKGNQTAKEALEKFAASAPPPPVVSETSFFRSPQRDPNVPARWGFLIGDQALLDRVLASSNLLEALDENGETPLTAVVKARHLELARTLLEHGAKIPPPRLPPPNYYGMGEEFKQVNLEKTPLLWAVTHGDKEAVTLLLEFKAPLDAVDQDGKTPLHYAVERKNKEMVQLLLDAKAPVDAVSKDGATPLLLAETAENEEIAKLLRAAGAAPSSSAPIPSQKEMRAIATRICAGDAASFDELAKAAEDLYLGMDGRTPQARRMLCATRMSAAFDVLGEAAAKDNNNAFEALKKCLTQNNALKSFAPDALGKAAAAGYTQALDILVNFRQWGMLENTAYFALQAAADANQEPAVDMFIALATDPASAKKQYYGISWMVKEVLQSAASRGNQKALEALEKFIAASAQARN